MEKQFLSCSWPYHGQNESSIDTVSQNVTEPMTNEQHGETTALGLNKEAMRQLHSPKMEEESQVLSWAREKHIHIEREWIIHKENRE